MKLSSYLGNVGAAIVYSVVYILCYIRFLNYQFGYSGYTLYPRSMSFLALSVFIATVPVLCYRGLRAFSSVLSVFVFLLLYIPIVLTFALGSDRSLEEIVLIQVTFMVSMCLLFLADAVVVKNPLDLHSNVNLMRWIFGATVVATIYVLFVYRGNLRLVSFADVYEQRSANAALSSGLAIRYVSTWLFSVLAPLCLAYGLIAKRYRYFAVGSAGCLAIYMATAEKAAVLLPIIFVGIFALFAKGRLKSIYALFAGTLSVMMVTLLAVANNPKSLSFLISSLLMMRTVGTGGLLTMRYYDFFSFHPLTEYTHIGLVGMITGAYPYGSVQVGQVIGQYYFSFDMNANANFWAMDGIAALGLIGVPLISIVCALLFVAMNAVTRGYNRLFVVLCFLPFLVALLNRGLLSSIWSGGAFFLLLFFLFNSRNAGLVGFNAEEARPA